MTTLNNIINSMKQAVNETVIEDLSSILTHDQAVKAVLSADDFDLVASAEQNPVIEF